MRGYLGGDTAHPFVTLATQNKEVVRLVSSAGLIFFGTATSSYVNDPRRYTGDHRDLDAVIAAVGQVVDGVFTVLPGSSQSTIAYEGYKTLGLIGSVPNRQYEPYTPQFVDL